MNSRIYNTRFQFNSYQMKLITCVTYLV